MVRSCHPFPPGAEQGGAEHGAFLRGAEEGSRAHGFALHRRASLGRRNGGGGCATCGALLVRTAAAALLLQPVVKPHLALKRFKCLHACSPPAACRAAFEGNLDELRRMLPSLTHRQRLQLDSQGNTVSGWRLQALLGHCERQHLGRSWAPWAGRSPQGTCDCWLASMVVATALHPPTLHSSSCCAPSCRAQALHVAVLRHQLEAIRLLLEAGVPPDVKNQRMWNPIDEAIALQDAETTKLLYRWG